MEASQIPDRRVRESPKSDRFESGAESLLSSCLSLLVGTRARSVFTVSHLRVAASRQRCRLMVTTFCGDQSQETRAAALTSSVTTRAGPLLRASTRRRDGSIGGGRTETSRGEGAGRRPLPTVITPEEGAGPGRGG